MENLPEEKSDQDYLLSMFAAPLNGLKDLVGKTWLLFYAMVAFWIVGRLISRLPNVDISRFVSITSLLIVILCLGVALVKSPDLRKWGSPGRAELLGIVCSFCIVGFLINAM